MRKIINGHRYDTDTAKRLGSADYSTPTDLNYWCEELYRTNSGMYFLHGEGGPASRYAETTGQNSWKSGEKIMEMSEESAKKWAEDNLPGEEYDAIWPEAPGETVPVSVILTESIVAAMDARKDADHSSRSDIITRALKAYLGQ